MSTKKVFEIEDLTVSLKGKKYYDKLSFTIYEGDRYMLMGKNASGKSLLLELLFNGYTNGLCKRYESLSITGHIWNKDGIDIIVATNLI